MKARYIIGTLYGVCVVLAFGSLNANWRHEPWHLAGGQNAREARITCSFAAGASVGGPISLAFAAVVSGFFYDGLSYSCAPVLEGSQP